MILMYILHKKSKVFCPTWPFATHCADKYEKGVFSLENTCTVHPPTYFARLQRASANHSSDILIYLLSESVKQVTSHNCQMLKNVLRILRWLRVKFSALWGVESWDIASKSIWTCSARRLWLARRRAAQIPPSPVPTLRFTVYKLCFVWFYKLTSCRVLTCCLIKDAGLVIMEKFNKKP